MVVHLDDYGDCVVVLVDLSTTMNHQAPPHSLDGPVVTCAAPRVWAFGQDRGEQRIGHRPSAIVHGVEAPQQFRVSDVAPEIAETGTAFSQDQPCRGAWRYLRFAGLA